MSRSIKKGPFVDSKLLKKVLKAKNEARSNKVINSGSIKTFPALSSSSSSIYSNEMSIQHIKERLSFSAAKKIHMRLNLIMQKLN